MNLHLYVWEGVLQDWSSGFVAVLAVSEEQAWELIKQGDPSAYTRLQHESKDRKQPRIVEAPEAFIFRGGS